LQKNIPAKHWEIQIQRHPNVGFVHCATIWARDETEAKMNFTIQNKDYIRPFDMLNIIPCLKCEECNGRAKTDTP
jgi:hypothetical protein